MNDSSIEKDIKLLNDSIGERIKKKRIEKGYTAKKFASLLEIPYSTYSNYENNNRTPQPGMILKIAEKLQIDASELLGCSLGAYMAQPKEDAIAAFTRGFLYPDEQLIFRNNLLGIRVRIDNIKNDSARRAAAESFSNLLLELDILALNIEQLEAASLSAYNEEKQRASKPLLEAVDELIDALTAENINNN